MVDAEVVHRRLRRLDETVARLRDIAARGRESFLADDTLQAAAERRLQVGIQIVLDIGAHVLSERGVLDWEEYRQGQGVTRRRRMGQVPSSDFDRGLGGTWTFADATDEIEFDHPADTFVRDVTFQATRVGGIIQLRGEDSFGTTTITVVLE